MHCLVTGAAGFIGSHLCDRLLADGHRVTGADCFTPYYPRPAKERNLAAARRHPAFELREVDLIADPLADVVAGADVVFHLAAMPGLTRSWLDFDQYNRHNLVATHRLLEAVRGKRHVRKFVYASTSSVYGRYAGGDEGLPLKPASPYGITKLAGENLSRVYHDEFDVPTVVLRYFSVYGPRQRPDMGYHQFIDAVLRGRPVPLTGDGMQVRGNTYVGDCVEATAAAGFEAAPGEVYNVGGGELATVLDVIRRIEKAAGKAAVVDRKPARRGDQLATGADVSKLHRHLGWKPTTALAEGIARQVEWHRELLADKPADPPAAVPAPKLAANPFARKPHVAALLGR